MQQAETDGQQQRLPSSGGRFASLAAEAAWMAASPAPSASVAMSAAPGWSVKHAGSLRDAEHSNRVSRGKCHNHMTFSC